jgi:hypothetical protein
METTFFSRAFARAHSRRKARQGVPRYSNLFRAELAEAAEKVVTKRSTKVAICYYAPHRPASLRSGLSSESVSTGADSRFEKQFSLREARSCAVSRCGVFLTLRSPELTSGHLCASRESCRGQDERAKNKGALTPYCCNQVNTHFSVSASPSKTAFLIWNPYL